MSEIDWSKAPEGATHWMPESCEWLEGFWKRVGRANYFYEKGKWEFSGGKPFGHPNLVERPSPSPAWSGDGLPPVGIVCEVLNSELSDPEWEECKILFSGNHRVLYDSQSCYERVGYIENLQFRPIRTPEQIVAAEREVVISEIISIIRREGAFDIDDPEVTASAIALYRAGYRKQENPE